VDASIVAGARPEPGRPSEPPSSGTPDRRLRTLSRAIDRAPAGAIPVILFGIACLVYLVFRPYWETLYIHFVYQADAWLHGRAAIEFPVWTPPYANDFYQDVLALPDPYGYGLIPYPPLPAVVLLPFVALFGMSAPQAFIGAILGAVNVVLAWRLTWRLSRSRLVALAATLFFGFGTVAWYASMIGSTWYFAHVVALGLALLAVTVALGAGDRRSRWGRLAGSTDGRLFLAGLLLGLAGLARLTVVLGAPFLVLAGSGPPWRRTLAVGLGIGIPVAALCAYNLATTGALFHPAYAYAAASELHPVPEFYHADWGLEDIRYIPQNLFIALGLPPEVHLECGIGLFDPACGTIAPNPLGMSVLLVSPAYFLAVPYAWRNLHRPVVLGAVLAIAAIGFANLAHFSQGWVQFGYRFSNDWAPFALVLVTLAIAKRGVDRLVVVLVAISVAVNLWGVYWGIMSGW
jgi:hypothetical protein